MDLPFYIVVPHWHCFNVSRDCYTIAMTLLKNSSLFNIRTITDIFSRLLSIFLECFILIALFCSNFSQGDSVFKFIDAQSTVSDSYRLYIPFCDKEYACFINTSRQSDSDHICSNIKCSSILRNRTLNCHEKYKTSIKDDLIFDLRCNLLERKHLRLKRQKSNLFDSNYLKSYHIQRRLLSKSKSKSKAKTKGKTKTTQIVPKNDSLATDPDVENDERAETTKEPFNYTEFIEVVEYLKRKRSKDPFWAMFSILTLIGILVWAMWCCGMKRIQTHKFINVTIDERFHYVSVRDILKSKKKYLSKKILQFKRRHMHRKHKYRRLKEQKVNIENNDDHDVVSDNSEDERLIYANDF